MSVCTCSCAPSEHRKNGCRVWFGDKNTGFRCNCDWNGKPPEPLNEHHILVVVKTSDSYLDAMCKLVAKGRDMFEQVEAHGLDHRKESEKTAEFVEERNLAVAECHRLRCELEAVHSETLIADRDAAKTECERLQDYIVQLHEQISGLKDREAM